MSDQYLRRQILQLAVLPRAERARLLKKLPRRQSRYIRSLLLSLSRELKVRPDRFEEVARECLEENQSETLSPGDSRAVGLSVFDRAGDGWLEALPDIWIASLLHVFGKQAADVAIQSLPSIRRESIRAHLKTLDRPFPEKLRNALLASVPEKNTRHITTDGGVDG